MSIELMYARPQQQTLTLTMIEGSLAAILFASSFAWPDLGSRLFRSAERFFGRLARRRMLAVLIVGLSALVLRIAILPWCGVPLPFVPDDFSFLLSSDTFAHGRLANPTPAMWIHFESIHIDMRPTYVSMYFPSQGLVMAAAQVLFGQPWLGILVMSALMCGGICWMLQAWLPPTWSFLGGMLCVFHLGLFSYWVNTFHSAGTIAALGGSLVLGSLPRLRRNPITRYAVLMAIGFVLSFTTRPFESMLLFIPVIAWLGHWLLTSSSRDYPFIAKRIAIPLVVLVCGASWMGYYDYRAFGSPFTLPYTINRATYAIAPYFAWQEPRPEPRYHHVEMQRFYHIDELDDYQRARTIPGYLGMSLLKLTLGVLFFSGLALLPLLLMARRVFIDRRTRFLIICLLFLGAGMLVEIFLIPHYLAPFTAAIYALGLQATRHMYCWKPGGKRVGTAWVRLTAVLIVGMSGLRLFARPLNLSFPEWPSSTWNFSWYGPDVFGAPRRDVAKALENLPGKQLAVVRYGSEHNPQDEWVYNAADIENAKVIWARDMDPNENQDLINYYRDRKVWLVQPDMGPSVTPYPVSEKVIAGNR
jgi:hypothetical protein